MKDSSKLKKINLQLTRLADVDTELLAKGVNRLEQVDFGYANLHNIPRLLKPKTIT